MGSCHLAERARERKSERASAARGQGVTFATFSLVQDNDCCHVLTALTLDSGSTDTGPRQPKFISEITLLALGRQHRFCSARRRLGGRQACLASWALQMARAFPFACLISILKAQDPGPASLQRTSSLEKPEAGSRAPPRCLHRAQAPARPAHRAQGKQPPTRTGLISSILSLHPASLRSLTSTSLVIPLLLHINGSCLLVGCEEKSPLVVLSESLRVPLPTADENSLGALWQNGGLSCTKFPIYPAIIVLEAGGNAN